MLFLIKQYFAYYIYIVCLFFLFSACQNELRDITRVQLQSEAGVELAKDIEIFYSDSAVVRMKVKSPLMLYYLDIKNPRREFPKGVEVDFFDA